MTIPQYHAAVAEADRCSDRDTYISDFARAPIWDDPDGAEVPAGRLDDLAQIWDACHRSVKDIAAMNGLSMRKLAERFCYTYRAMESWSGGQRGCAVQVRLMMQQVLGNLSVEIK